MYCFVQYKCDGQKVIVPSSFVKDFDNLHFDQDKIYEVFWSPDPNDTPLKILSKQNKIITVDKEVELARKKKNASPVKGYYFAKILLVADTEQELESTLDSKEGRNGKTKNKPVKDISETKQKETNKVSELIKKGKKRSYENLKLQSVFSDSDSDDCIIPLKIHKDEVSELKKEIRILKEKNVKYKTKYESLKVKYNETSNLNITLQQRLLKPTESSLSLSENTFTDAPSPTIFTVAPSAIASPLSTPTYAQLNSIPASVDDTVSENFPGPAIPSMENLEEHQFQLEESHFNRVTFRVKPGPLGDSLFVKNLASAVFGDEVLMTSSVTGNKCNAKKDSVAKPALCPKRLHYIKELLNERISREIPECPMTEKEKRLSKVNGLIAQKIATLLKKK